MHTDITNEKNMKGLVGGPLLVGGLGPGPPAPLKSGPVSAKLLDRSSPKLYTI